jgi:hypothetical protein
MIKLPGDFISLGEWELANLLCPVAQYFLVLVLGLNKQQHFHKIK